MSVFKKEMARRDAMGMILKTVAAAAGMSVIDLELFLSKGHAATLVNLKMLKIMLSGMNRQVFEAEFGRVTPRTPTGHAIAANKLQKIMVPGMKPGTLPPGANMGMSCMVNLGGQQMPGSFCVNLSGCGGNGDSCPCLSDCTENVCSGQDFGDETGTGCRGNCPTNDCNGQSCEGLTSCGDNECSDQSCVSFSSCKTNKRNLVEVLNTYRTDPYVQGLMRYFNTTNTVQLANQVGLMIQQRRYITPAQVLQTPSTVTPSQSVPKGIQRQQKP
jgi:hypothetical protein